MPQDPIEPLDSGAKTYLAAVRAAAIYVSFDNGYAKSVGATLDLDKALNHIRRLISPTVYFAWVAWSSDFGALAKIAQTKDILLEERQDDGVKFPLTLVALVERIENLARANGVKLTSHYFALQRAQIYADHLNQALAEMKQAGLLAEFNQAYKAYRLELLSKGKVAPPYWAILEDLRGVIIRSLIQNDCSSILALPEIRKAFPWFTRKSLTR